MSTSVKAMPLLLHLPHTTWSIGSGDSDCSGDAANSNFDGRGKGPSVGGSGASVGGSGA
eukprot:CAMPEP_0174726952 /NCGR_PEP_ID=MMETSP1094-20130205/48773_1 /TAXON_ID=156173 /ORGANISM="Chrysochromulina brevifilum, Strain UTEX LB 985" /LENGTH=58 /DNA_ID=CAMNT_0015928593 /DNA_START=143 /DNA_END=316 /DNA_ORIENTATION=-